MNLLQTYIKQMLDKLDGKKTYLAALVAAIIAANQVLQFLPPDVASMLMWLAGALGLAGIRSALAKATPPPADPFDDVLPFDRDYPA